MTQSTPRARVQAFKDLKLDGAFFTSMLTCKDEDDGDFDVYLMEHGVMPVLLQGLDALSRHVNKLASGTAIGLGSGKRIAFNPLIWLAQFMLRNHPGYVRDHRTPMYSQISDLAAAERGRRTLLRQQYYFRNTWREMAKEDGKLPRSQVMEMLQKMDDLWNLEGQFVRKLPDFGSLIAGAHMEVSFDEFWTAFEAFVLQNDVVRTSAFEEAHAKRLQAENEAQTAADEAARREQALAEVMQKRKSLEEQFETISADVYINSELSQIISKGATVAAQNGIAEDGSLELQGEHIMLVCLMLRLWGFPTEPEDEHRVAPKDEWDSAAMVAWQRWLAEWGPRNADPNIIDAVSLKALLDKDAFEACLVQNQGSAFLEDEDVTYVEVQSLIESDLNEVMIEALDKDSGNLLKLPLAENQVEEVRSRLADGGEPLRAKVELVSRRVRLEPRKLAEMQAPEVAAEEQGEMELGGP